MKVNCIVLSDADLADVRGEISQIQKIVQTASMDLAARIRTRAPKKTGDLISGIIPSPWEENSAYPGKIVRQVYMDADMNDVFVKYAKNGKRYYYPASQEYGFRIARRNTLTLKQELAYGSDARRSRVPGKYFMADTFVEYVPAFVSEVEDLVDKVVGR